LPKSLAVGASKITTIDARESLRGRLSHELSSPAELTVPDPAKKTASIEFGEEFQGLEAKVQVCPAFTHQLMAAAESL
jgi:hypothetical protein